ncbi:hypothetical protein FRB94_004295 [Tulasnella sp. JGI-2019a]|nr:hypothetical protein FRB93_000296 [Tulasnella sp. JGI-2019a]KAG9015176.1 hypothetical protein FRB94_004295 [Tulasnella sp. JGI-2019a]KAG9039245.1 hypothetical protein FRB95_011830 [Tulasnella sp. JGI-2019a]
MAPIDPPNRNQRKMCWAGRDQYYACLDALNIIAPGEEGNKCAKELAQFQAACAASWVDHFNKRRVFEIRKEAVLRAENAQ